MSAPKYTPGPWDVGNSGVTVYAGGTWVADCDTELAGASRAEIPANAALIAAAPDMAEALRLMLKEWRSPGCADKGCLVCEAQDAAVAAGRAALKKAGVEL